MISVAWTLSIGPRLGQSIVCSCRICRTCSVQRNSGGTHQPVDLSGLIAERLEAITTHAVAIEKAGLYPQPLPPKLRHHVGGNGVREVIIGRRAAGRAEPFDVAGPIAEALERGGAEQGAVVKALQHQGEVFEQVAKQFPGGGEVPRFDHAALNALRDNPSGNGVVVGLDFTVDPYVSPVR